ncbi:hypothetical protein DSM112329_04737 [Paraconexibacter sp. AEG42_29]|uniref:HTH marR-type domain-containing protein n=1 Tax=Paraconexibacter sp. AEG42_29 TaxID=2997339 RepID=A0AAU7B1U2_9ACTN
MAIIEFYGRFWDPAYVNWGRKGPGGQKEVSGTYKVDGESKTFDVAGQPGIYVLHHAWTTIYVGTATGDITGRLANHRRDRLAGRWDRFSWFTLPDQAGPLDHADLVATVEALLIFAAPSAETSENRAQATIRGAHEVKQAGRQPALASRSLLEKIAADLDALTLQVSALSLAADAASVETPGGSEPDDSMPSPARLARGESYGRIIDALSTGKWQREAALVRATGLSQPTTHQALKRLVERGEVERDDAGGRARFRLAPAADGVQAPQ